MAELKERWAVQLVEMKNWPITAFLEQNNFAKFMLVELSQIVFHHHLYLRLFTRLITFYVIPLILSPLAFELEIVRQSFGIGGVCDIRRCFSELSMNFQKIDMYLEVGFWR
jgi:hypothetical protein